MDAATLDLLGFNRVLERIQGWAQTEGGRHQVGKMRPLQDQTRLERRRVLVSQLSSFVRDNPFPSLEQAQDLPSTLQTLRHEGSVLEGEQLVGLSAVFELSGSLAKAFEDAPSCTLLEEAFRPFASLLAEAQRIQSVVDEKGHVRSSADPELGKVRKGLVRDRKQVEASLKEFFTGPPGRHLIDQPFITRRNDRFVIPVKAEAQQKIQGVVHAASSSGASVFLEPFEVVQLNNALLAREAQELRIVRRLLARLSEEIRPLCETISSMDHRLAWLDALHAVCRFQSRYRCTWPVFSVQGRLAIQSARHPLLEDQPGQEPPVPISVELKPSHRVVVISGPNAGGKTVALKTIGLFSSLAQAGIPVPAAQAELPFFNRILADIGDHQSLDRNLSTFSAHILRVVEILDSVEGPSLVLLDELGTGTDPEIGSALAVELVETLSQSALVVVTTHLDGLKRYAETATHATNASVALDSRTLLPTYELTFGNQGASSALEIARQLGLPEEILERAHNRLSDDQREMRDYLRSLRRQKNDLSEASRQLEREMLRVEELRLDLERGENQREAAAKKQLQSRLEELELEYREQTRRVLKTIRDKFEAARVRRETQRKRQLLRETFRQTFVRDTPSGPDPQTGHGFQEGDTVWCVPFKKTGKILELAGAKATIQVEGKHIHLPTAQLREAGQQRVTRFSGKHVRLDVVEDSSSQLSLIGQHVEDAIDRTDKFLDRAVVSQLREVRLIHGIGSGRLRAALKRFLEGHPQVGRITVEGGSTIVSLRDSEAGR